MVAAVAFSSLVALTLSAMLASKLLKKKSRRNKIVEKVDQGIRCLRHYYSKSLHWCMQHLLVVSVLFVGMLVATVWLLQQIPSEYAPRYYRGSFIVVVIVLEGTCIFYLFITVV